VRKKRHEEEIARKLKRFLDHKKNVIVNNVSVKSIRISSLLFAFDSRIEDDMNRYACLKILNCIEVYYKINALFDIRKVDLYLIKLR
jgi:hypothetical protein